MGIFFRLSKGDLRLPVHRMELGRIRFVLGLLVFPHGAGVVFHPRVVS